MRPSWALMFHRLYSFTPLLVALNYLRGEITGLNLVNGAFKFDSVRCFMKAVEVEVNNTGMDEVDSLGLMAN